MSPLFFVNALDIYPKQKDSITAKMLFDGKLLTFVDDIKISIKSNEIAEILHVVNHRATFGLTTNLMKCNYVCP